MLIKNSMKIFAAKFSAVYVIMLYMVIAVVILASISLFAIVPVYNFFYENGIVEQVGELLSRFMINGYSSDLVSQMLQCVDSIRQLLLQRYDMLLLLLLFVVFIWGALCRFIIGMIEIPLQKKIKGAMSDNANYGFFGLFISTLGKSALFSFVKILIKFTADLVVYSVVYFIAAKFIYSPLSALTPFIICLMLVVYYAFKYAMTCCWGPAIAVDEMGVFHALAYSAKVFFQNFSKMFGVFIVVWFIVVFANFFLIRYTFGAGIIISVPISMLIFNVLDITFYYNHNSYRYYAGDEIVNKGKEN